MPPNKSPAVIMHKIRSAESQVVQRAAKENPKEKTSATLVLRSQAQPQTHTQVRSISLVPDPQVQSQSISLISQKQKSLPSMVVEGKCSSISISLACDERSVQVAVGMANIDGQPIWEVEARFTGARSFTATVTTPPPSSKTSKALGGASKSA
ncbi:hypothetical protein BGX29_001987 [Mortierella sp. GBA35]|nr:hypothetical protein BGX29_001987 [Mortierella sp. GBA35]